MNIFRKHKTNNILSNNLYRENCYLCSRLSQQFLCPECEQQILWVRTHNNPNSKFCLRCGIEEFDVNNTEQYCEPCCNAIARLQGQPNFQITRNYPLAYYQGLFAELLHWYKFDKELPLAKYFHALLQQVYFTEFANYSIIPVPPREAKLKREAWDQVGYICRKPFPIMQLLQRNATVQQKRLNREQRLEQLYNSDTYSLALPARRLVWQNYCKRGPLQLLLVDDVYTTGATIDMCRRALYLLEKEGWISEVRSLSLCLVP